MVDSSSSLFTRFKAKLNDKMHKEIPAQSIPPRINREKKVETTDLTFENNSR